MGITHRFRMLRKSISSSSSGGRSDEGQTDIATTPSNNTTPGTTPPTPTPTTPLSKTTSRLAKITSWRSNHSSSSSSSQKDGSSPPTAKPTPNKRKSAMAKRKMHPSERPMTDQNLQHQEMLGTFTMKFGRSRRFSRGARSSFSGVSPGSSRPGSVDHGRGSVASIDDAGPYGLGRITSLTHRPEDRIAEAEESS